MTPRTASIVTMSAAAAIASAHTIVRRVARTWGATCAEAEQPLPGDDLVPAIDSQITRAVSIHASPEQVWPWLVQMGVDRGGLYTHTWVENGLLRLNVTNAESIEPKWQDLEVGDHIWFVPEGASTPQFGPRVMEIEPNRHLICILGEEPDSCQGTWQFVLRPQGPGRTRLLFRHRESSARSNGTKIFDLIAEPAYLYMEIGMLNGIKARAERGMTASSPGRES